MLKVKEFVTTLVSPLVDNINAEAGCYGGSTSTYLCYTTTEQCCEPMQGTGGGVTLCCTYDVSVYKHYPSGSCYVKYRTNQRNCHY